MLTGLLIVVSRVYAVNSAPWPTSTNDLVFTFVTAEVPIYGFLEEGKLAIGAELKFRNRATVDRHGRLRIDNGSFIANGLDAYVSAQIAKADAFTIELYAYPESRSLSSKGTLVTNGNFALVQNKDTIFLQIYTSTTTKQPITIELYRLLDLRPLHLAVSWNHGVVTSFVNGEQSLAGTGNGNLSSWTSRNLVIGDSWDQQAPWMGALEGIAIFSRSLSTSEIVSDYEAYKEVVADRVPLTALQIRAKLEAKSIIPTLDELAPYRNSLVVSKYSVEKVLEGTYSEKEIYVAQWSVLDGAYLPIKDLPAGTVREFDVEEFGKQPQLQHENISDTVVSDFSLPLYFEIGHQLRDEAEGSEKVIDDSPKENNLNIPTMDVAWPTLKEQESRKARIDTNSRHMTAVVAALPSRLAIDPYLERIRAIPEAKGMRYGKANINFGGLDYIYEPSLYPVGATPAQIPSNQFDIIVDINRQLLAKGIHLIFVPVPTSVDIYPDYLIGDFPKDGTLVPEMRRLIEALTKQNVEVVDLLPVYQKARSESDELLCLPWDTHWSNAGVKIAAREISTRLKEYDIVRKSMASPAQYHTKETEVLLSLANPSVDMTIPVTSVLTADERPYKDNDASPILIIGDSFTFANYRQAGAHLGAHIAREINMPLALLGRGGYGGNAPRELAGKGADYVHHHRIVIWVVANRYFGSWARSRWSTATIP